MNEYRTMRVAEILDDFRTLQYFIAAVAADPPNMEDYYTEGWAALRQCALDGQHILNCAADVSVPRTSGGPEEQAKAELKQFVFLSPFPPSSHPVFSSLSTCRMIPVLIEIELHRVHLDAYARRHEGQKIYLRQAAAQRWIEWREQLLTSGQSHSSIASQLRAIDQQLRSVSLCSLSLVNDQHLTEQRRSWLPSPTRPSTPSSKPPISAWAAGPRRTQACALSSAGSGPAVVRRFQGLSLRMLLPSSFLTRLHAFLFFCCGRTTNDSYVYHDHSNDKTYETYEIDTRRQ